MNSYLRKSLTLIELLIAIGLLSVIILAISNIDLFTRFHTISADRRAKLQNEVSYALEHMTKQISGAIGYSGDWAVKAYTDNKGVRVRIDNNPANGRIDATDSWLAYRHENIGTTDSEIRFYADAGSTETPAGTYETIARRIAITSGTFYGVEFSGNFDASGWLNDNTIEVKIVGRWEPAQAASPDNPEVVIRTKIKMPSVSTH